jgi:hypothetical protein
MRHNNQPKFQDSKKNKNKKLDEISIQVKKNNLGQGACHKKSKPSDASQQSTKGPRLERKSQEFSVSRKKRKVEDFVAEITVDAAGKESRVIFMFCFC